MTGDLAKAIFGVLLYIKNKCLYVKVQDTMQTIYRFYYFRNIIIPQEAMVYNVQV